MFNAGDANFDSTNFNIILNIIYSYDAKLNFTEHHYSSLQCHMILQKSL